MSDQSPDVDPCNARQSSSRDQKECSEPKLPPDNDVNTTLLDKKTQQNLADDLRPLEQGKFKNDPPKSLEPSSNDSETVNASTEEITMSQLSNDESIDINIPQGDRTHSLDDVEKKDISEVSINCNERNTDTPTEETPSSSKSNNIEPNSAIPYENRSEKNGPGANTGTVEVGEGTVENTGSENEMEISKTEVVLPNLTVDIVSSNECGPCKTEETNKERMEEKENSAIAKPNDELVQSVNVSILSDNISAAEGKEINSSIVNKKTSEPLMLERSSSETKEKTCLTSQENKDDRSNSDKKDSILAIKSQEECTLKIEKKISDIKVDSLNKISCNKNEESSCKTLSNDVGIKDDSMEVDDKDVNSPKTVKSRKTVESITIEEKIETPLIDLQQELTKSLKPTKMDVDDVKEDDKPNQLSEMEVDEVPKENCVNTVKKSSINGDKTNNRNDSGSSSSSDESGNDLYRNNFKQLFQSLEEKKEKLRKIYFPGENDKNDAEVICLEDDDDDDDDDDVKIIAKPAAAVNCINPNCMSGKDLAKPAVFVLNYFGLKRNKGQQVCAECFRLVAEHISKLGNMLMNKEPLINAEFPNFRDVILLDSDEENDSEDEGNLSDDTMSMIQENIDDVIAECMDKVDFNNQIRESSVILNTKFDNLQEEAKELNDRFNAVQHTLDEFRRDIYKHFTQPIQELEEVNFSDCEIPPMPLVRDKLRIRQYNQELIQSLRKQEQQQKETEERARQQAYAQKNAAKKESLGYETIQEVVALQSNTRCEPPPNLPPPGPLLRRKLQVGEMVFTMKVSYFSVWSLVRVLEVIPRNPTENDTSTESYRVRFEQLKKVKTVTGKYLAYAQPANVQLRVGTRVIAIFKDEESELSCKDNYYVGVVAEPPKSTNKYRYLVFFDDGYTQYCPHDNVLVVVESSPNVWEDIHPEPRDFIKNYLSQYPERPMVKLSCGQVVKVEWNGKWWIVRVLEVDGSLVKVHFNADNRTEWIYRGSTRLGPMYQELTAAKERQSGIRPSGFGSSASHKNKALPYVEYTRGDGEEKKDEEKETSAEPVPVRSVARKSTAKKPPEPVVTNVPYTKPLFNQVPQGKVSQRLFKKATRPLTFSPHQCNRSCVSWTDYNPDIAKKYDPLVKPLMFGFERLSMNYRGRTLIFYRGPCGRMIRNPQEMICFLTGTKSLLTIDMFDFDFWVNVTSEFKEATTFCRIEDLSYGKESVPISCVNELDHSMPQYVEYLTARNPTRGVNLNLDPDFLVGCDCKDDCSNREDCSCWQLTMQGKSYLPDGDLDPVFGYQFRRLSERVATGIYECNSRCGCSSSCQNRVAQQPLSCRLQLFKTPKKGWGIRCLHDIPRGAFICIYAGFLLTDQEANEGGKTYGDEYLAELDYIESVEGLKQGYESEAKEMSDLEEEDDVDDSRKQEMKDEEFSQGQASQASSDGDNSLDAEDKPSRGDIRLRLRRRKEEECERESKKAKPEDDAISISDEDTETNGYYYTVLPVTDQASRKPQTFDANITKTQSEDDEYPSVRDLYGPDERVFIMDAKTHGNIGRYLNHSCSPNVFVQNVFVDSHDLRFPWVAFFASQYIPAGQELTWDYNYDVGSVPGKVMHCYCASANCRGRLL